MCLVTYEMNDYMIEARSMQYLLPRTIACEANSGMIKHKKQSVHFGNETIEESFSFSFKHCLN
jgi:hypothetical protein